MELAYKIKNLDESKLAAHGTPTKVCSSCDPDVPGHQNRPSCTVCRGTGREPLSFMSTLLELSESRREASCDKKRGGRNQSDSDLYIEY